MTASGIYDRLADPGSAQAEAVSGSVRRVDSSTASGRAAAGPDPGSGPVQQDALVGVAQAEDVAHFGCGPALHVAPDHDLALAAGS
jgi:hypothetical protein